MSTTEIVQALVSPAEKLIEAVSGAIGKAYEPRHIRKMADAKAYEVQLIADTVRNNSDVPIVYNSSGVSIDTSNFEEIAKRASSRLAYQEITKQQNIEAVVDNAYQELEGFTSVSNEPIDKDWMFRFFNSVENISDEEMQRIWGHILAGEITLPNTYSYRTLEKLKNMTHKEARLFQHVSSIALQTGKTRFILIDDKMLEKYDINHSHILKLEECGLMIAHELSVTLSISNNKTDSFFNSKILGMVKGSADLNQDIQLPIFVFTESGAQLIKAIHSDTCEQYVFDCLERIRRTNNNIVVTAHNIESIDIDAEKITYNKVDILPHEENTNE